MKRVAVYLFILQATGCTNNAGNKNVTTPGMDKQTVPGNQHFFPVTNYLQGQVMEIKARGINPLKITTINDLTDSAWIKIEDVDAALASFFRPVIDTSNLNEFFKEAKFLDQTLDAYTFTYEPVRNLPDSLTLQRWDVYIDPSRYTVKRIYLVKKENNKTLLLTWQSDKWCKTVTVTKDGKIEREELIKWKF